MTADRVARQVLSSVSTGTQEVPVIVPDFGALGATWELHLLAQVDHDWRPHEWDSEEWAFVPTPDRPGTRLFLCERPRCGVRTTRTGLCVTCKREQKANGWTLDEVIAHPRTTGVVVRSNDRRPDCVVTQDGRQCEREQLSRGLCASHYQTFHLRIPNSKTDESLAGWLATGPNPFLVLTPCAVTGCAHERQSPDVPLCNSHHQARGREKRKDPSLSDEDFMRWIAEPFLPAYSLPLMVLPMPLRAELLVGMQSFDTERGLDWDAANWSKVFTRLRAARVASVLDRDGDDWLAAVDNSSGHIWRHLLHRIGVEDDRFHGRERDEAVLSSYDLGLNYQGKKPNKRIAHRQRDIDFRPVTQPWLRGAVVHYVRVQLPHMEEVRRLESLMTKASEHLRATLPSSDDPTSLSLGVMDSIVSLINRTWTAEKTQAGYFAAWWKVVDHASNNHLWDDVPRDFKREGQRHKATGTKSRDNEDDNGSALPEAVVRHLSRKLHLIQGDDSGYTRSGWTPTLRAAQYRALIAVLRDTGRRPNEIVALGDNCVRPDVDGKSWTLVWDNSKGKRLDRTLPIDSTLVAAIDAWQQVKAAAGITSKWLFPSSNSNGSHVSTGTIERALREWLTVTPPLEFPVMHLDGVRRKFDFETITPYSFRHTYAQRHADAGTDPQTLSELMDHKSMNTTMSYYRAGWAKKREAQDRLAAFTIDRHGSASPIPVSRRGLSQVAVPWGNCTEPTNVQAAGHACPTRFKCVGCDFYRPDPSYIPAIEMHIDQMRTEVAFLTAHGGPDYMLEANRAEIADYEKVVDQMNDHLKGLPEAEREQVEIQMAILRRSRAAEAAGFSLTLEPVDTTQEGES